MEFLDIQELKTQAQEALENGDLAKAKEILAQIKSVKETEAEQKAIEAELAELTAEEEEVVEAEEEVKEAETEEVEAEEEPVEDEELKQDKKGEERSMKEIQDLTSKVQDFETYIRTQGTETRGLDTTSGSVLVPVEVSNSVLELKNGQADLSQYVSKEAVGTGQGKFPVAKRAQAILATKAELAEIAEVNDPLFLEVEYKCQTRIGQIAFSNEVLEDAQIDVVAYAKRQMERMVVNTNNKNIMDVLKTFDAKAATNADELKRIVNVDLDPELDVKIIMNQDAYQVIDTMKDGNGRYLLQDSMASASGKMLFGKEVILVSNKLAATEGGKAGFIWVGDLKEAVFMAQRNEISAEWDKFDRYSKGLAVGIRSDYKKIDGEAGKLVNFTQAAK